MKVKFLHSLAGVAHSWAPGDVGEVSVAEAKRLIAAGFAEAAVADKAGVETAAKPKVRRK